MAILQMPGPPKDLASVIERKPGLLKAGELALLLGCGNSTIYEMVAANRIPYVRIGSKIRFDPVVIAGWLRDHSVDTAA